MSFFRILGLDPATASIDWEMKPADTFGMFESWGGKERVKNKSERFYYFYIDAWQPPATLQLMERGIKYARILARIKAPQGMIDKCVVDQGRSSTLDASYAINDSLRGWLQKNVVDNDDHSLVVPLDVKEAEELTDTGLPGTDEPVPALQPRILRSDPLVFKEDKLAELIIASGLFEKLHNPEGSDDSYLVDNGDNLTVSDLTTDLMWQRTGSEINSIRTIRNWVEGLNSSGFAGYDDWRLPTFEEALSLLKREKNNRELYLHPVFSAGQPFIFTTDKREPGGHWFVDFAQARVFWASGFNPGGFGRVCRKI